MTMFHMINRRINKMSEDTVVNWTKEVMDQMEAVNEQLEATDIEDVTKVMYLLDQQNDLELCLEILNERLEELVEDRVNALMDLIHYFSE